jgi:peptidoglycan/LPS O-acetylase OafA/YrhL
MTTTTRRWRKVLVADLLAYNIAILLFAFFPPATLNTVEFVVMLSSALCGLGVMFHAAERVSLPMDQWAYLATGAVGLFTLCAYGTMSTHSLTVKIPFMAFILAGVISGYAGHVIDGGVKRDLPQ